MKNSRGKNGQKDTVVEAAGEKGCALIKSKEKVRFFHRELLQLKKKDCIG